MGFAALVVLATSYVAAGRIEPRLPAESASTCFEGRFDGATDLTFGFPHEKRTEKAHVTRLVLRLDRAPGQEPHVAEPDIYRFDWRYDIRLAAETSDQGHFTSSAQCDWTDEASAGLTPDPSCFIDCDGGGLRVSRVPARPAIDMIWETDGWLRISACGGGGEILRGGATTKTFRLEAAPNDVCKDIPLAGN